MIEEIGELQQLLLKKSKISYKRYFYDSLEFDKLTGLLGARGVGKTTFLLWYFKNSKLSFSKKLYFSADSININSLFDLAKEFAKSGGKLLIIDEIHKFGNFESELKKIYDFLDLQVIFSGSSALKIDNSKADLSRRAIIYEVEGMSFREFLELKHNIKLNSYSLEDILHHHVDIAYDLLEKFDISSFKEYLEFGYYPFYFDKKVLYKIKLNETINTVIEVDIPSIFNIEYQNIKNLKRLITLICESAPYTPNINELLTKMGMGSDYRSLYRYMDYLHKAKIIYLLKPKIRGDNIFSKPEKIYLNNPNLHYAYCKEPQLGTIRETFFATMLKIEHLLQTSKKGDFLVDEKYTFEVGGAKKSFKQIKDMDNSFVVADDVEIGFGAKIPLWLFGFLY
jgi:predicted AAA+ superfamily ATPase